MPHLALLRTVAGVAFLRAQVFGAAHEPAQDVRRDRLKIITGVARTGGQRTREGLVGKAFAIKHVGLY